MEAMAEAIKAASMYGDKILIGKLCRLMVNPSYALFCDLRKELLLCSDSLTVDDLLGWVNKNESEKRVRI